MIPNHSCASLSDLDLQMARAVRPGGNWKDIPETLPSQRLAQIRASCAAGEGSRSTYYGRLHPDRPSYTVNTYFNRPGNGCFLHYDFRGKQHRTLSHREAARLQSFPDSFAFAGSQRSVCQQIGNAVPPLLAFQIAAALGKAGVTVDLFSGAGGLSLGFEWAGWKSFAAVDNHRDSIATFNSNIANVGVVGDLTDTTVHDELCAKVENGIKLGSKRFALIGGPPCQGFSTGGKRRSVEDIRNALYKSYASLLGRLKPDIFVFENVTGLLTLDGGRFAARIIRDLRFEGYETVLWRLNAAHFGVPQRRERVIIIGVPLGQRIPQQPNPWTSVGIDQERASVCSVSAALDDLPSLRAGQDGSELSYKCDAESQYQRFVRGLITPDEYLVGGRSRNGPNKSRKAVRA